MALVHAARPCQRDVKDAVSCSFCNFVRSKQCSYLDKPLTLHRQPHWTPQPVVERAQLSPAIVVAIFLPKHSKLCCGAKQRLRRSRPLNDDSGQR